MSPLNLPKLPYLEALGRLDVRHAQGFRTVVRRAAMHYALMKVARDDEEAGMPGAHERLMKHFNRVCYICGWVDGAMARSPELRWFDPGSCVDYVRLLSRAYRREMK